MKRLRAYGIELTLVALLLGAVAFFGYLGYGLLSPEVNVDEFSGEQALAKAAEQMEFGPRTAGSENSQQMGDWLVGELRALGWDVIVQPYTVTLPPAEADAGSGAAEPTAPPDGDASLELAARNLIAVRDAIGQIGSEPAPVALLVTHYDTRLRADADPDPADRLAPAPGANSSASGTAVLMELARTLNVASSGHSVCLVFLDGEDNRDLPGWEAPFGGAYLVGGLNENIPRRRNPRFALVLDGVGGANQRVDVDGEASPELATAIVGVAEQLTFGDWIVGGTFTVSPTVEGPFVQAQIPTATLRGQDYAYRNTAADTLDKLSADTLERVGRTLEAWLEQGAPIAEP